MEILYKNFDKEHIPDNEAHYFDLIQSIIENVDKHSIFVITKNSTILFPYLTNFLNNRLR